MTFFFILDGEQSLKTQSFIHEERSRKSAGCFYT
jgi:hypothetical protein